MEFAARSLSRAHLPRPLSCSSSFLPFPFHPKYSSPASNSFGFLYSKCFPTQLQGLRFERRGRRTPEPLHASQSENPQFPAHDTVQWLLVPVGDGDSKHIGYKVEMPDAFEIVSDEVTVGRLPDKADIVIPVATVSGLHACIRKQEENLLITDLDSTNGTFVNDKRLSPGVVAAVSPGGCITFGDTHLAMFQVSKLKTVGAASELQESEEKRQSDEPTINEETN